MTTARHSTVREAEANSDSFPIRMNTLISAIGSAAEIARRCGFSEAVVRSWRDGKSDPSRERLLALCEGTGVSLFWIADGKGPMWKKDLPWAASVRGEGKRYTLEDAVAPDSQPLRLEGLTIAIQLAAEALDGKTLPPDDYAELVSLIYQGLEEGLPEASILRFARIAKPK